eukprot:1418245-Prymnesium_polylepis.1
MTCWCSSRRRKELNLRAQASTRLVNWMRTRSPSLLYGPRQRASDGKTREALTPQQSDQKRWHETVQHPRPLPAARWCSSRCSISAATTLATRA